MEEDALEESDEMFLAAKRIKKKRPTYVRTYEGCSCVAVSSCAFYIAFVCFLGMSGNLAVSS
jgi:hypothetical protein